MAQVIPFPTGLVAAANFAARATATGRRVTPPEGSNVIRLPVCQSVGTLEDQLGRMRESLAAEIGRMRPRDRAGLSRTIEGRRDHDGGHWIA